MGKIIQGRYAPLAIMGDALELMMRAIDRPRHLPGIVVLHGRSGLGKSTAAAFVSAETNAAYIEMRATWTTKYFLGQLARLLGVEERGTIPVILERVVEALARQRRPLIIDEADHLVGRRNVELLRDIYELSRAPMMLIGEQFLPDHLERWERVHNRILAMVRARPASIEDGLALRDLYCRSVAVADDLVAHIVEQTSGIVRRIVINLEAVQQTALAEGWETVDLARWGDRPVYVARADHGREAA